MKSNLKKIEVHLGLLTGNDLLLMVEKGTKLEFIMLCYRYAEGNNKFTQNYNKNKEPRTIVS